MKTISKSAFRKLLSIVMAVIMTFGVVPFGQIAMADKGLNASEAGSEVVNGRYVDGVWQAGGNGTAVYSIDGNEVTLSKTAAPVPGQENTYQVTLQVETSTSTSEVVSSENGAVVLVMDLSNSMTYCAECGGNGSHNNGCSHHSNSGWGWGNDNSVTTEQTRLYAAKEAARNFINMYAGTDASALRQVAIVAFDTDYRTELSWVNVAGGTGHNSYDSAIAAVNNLAIRGGNLGATNLEGGLYETVARLGDSAVANISAKSVIVLTDGTPTKGLNGLGSGSSGSAQLNQRAAEMAAQVKALSTLYTVCFGASNDYTYSGGPTVGNFLANSIATSSATAFDAENANELTVAFQQITEIITEGLSGEGWNVTDPMGAFINFANGPANFTSPDGQVYTWALSNAYTTNNGNTTVYVYTCTYYVTVNVQAEGFVEGQYYPVNGRTYLNVDGHQYEFPVPGVTGCLPRTSVTVTKVWDDNGNQDGVRPGSVTLQLMKDGAAYGEPVTVSAADNWQYTWTDLIAMSNGAAHVYTVVELNAPEGYAASYTGVGTHDLTVTNTHEAEKIALTVTKVWNDNNDQDGIRPSSITVALLKAGEQIATGTLTAANGWTYTFEGLDKNANGQPIVYTVEEINVPEGYTASVDDLVITNSHSVEKTSVEVSKVWNDDNNRDGVRPNHVTVKLLANGVETGATLTLSVGNNWTDRFTNLDKNHNGSAVVYTVEEAEVPGYTAHVSGNMTEGYTITNTHVPAVTEVAGHKTWIDNDNQDGARPASIVIKLVKEGETLETVTVTAANGWAWSFTNLPKYENEGTLINYSVVEDAVEDYSTTYDGYNVINTHTPAKTSVTVTKAWDDNNNQDGIRPNHIIVKLLANGVDTGVTMVLNAGNNWTGSFTELDKFLAGAEITYSVGEVEIEGYTTEITGDQLIGYTITNTHVPEVIEVAGHKIWNDNNDQDGMRPESITIVLRGNGGLVDTRVVTAEDGWAWSFTNLPKYENGYIISYVIGEYGVEGYTTTYDGYDVINTHATEKTSVTVAKVWADSNDQDGIRPNDVTVALLANGVATGRTMLLNAGNNWTGVFADLDKFAAGSEVIYSIAEVEVQGYVTVISGSQYEGYTVTNSHIPAVTEVAGRKIWQDNDDQDGARPASITVNLLKNGQVIDTAVVTAANGWAWSFTNLPMFENHGTPVVYTVSEVGIDGYTTEYDGFNIVNTHTPEETAVAVTKAWQDSYNQDGSRPNDVTISLLANGVPTGMTLVLNSGNNWQGVFTDLDKFANGQPVVYTVAEAPVPGYETVITGNQESGYVITNSHTPAVTCVHGMKVWYDNFDQDGVRPDSITINLLANGQVVETRVVTAADGWVWDFTNLPKYQDGVLINYTVTEEAVEGYYTIYLGEYVKNFHDVEKTTVTVTKAWEDNNDQDGIRPNHVTVTLFANGQDTGRTVTLSQGNGWTATFEDLDKFANGQPVVYTVAESPVPGYQAVVTGSAESGYVITNSHTPETVNVCGEKVWFDNDDQDGVRPDSITVHLLANGHVVATQVVTAENGWNFCFENVPKYDHGMQIVYTFAEDEVEGYSTLYCFNLIKNFHTPEKTNVTVSKVWEDSYNQDGIRPNDVTVMLLANGHDTGMRLVLNAGNNWQGAFEDLDKYAAGVAIHYTVAEAPVPGYETVITGSEAEGYVITNSHTPAVTCVHGMKVWYDNFNQDGVRPDSITINLLANGVVVDTIVVTAADGWVWNFTDLPKYENGQLINYTVIEAPVEGYYTMYLGEYVKNFHEPEKTSVTVTKAWFDNFDQDGIRPGFVTVALFANGMPTGATMVLSPVNNWTGTFTELDKYYNGVEIVYTVAEVPVPGYVTVITGDQHTGYVVTNTHIPCVTSVCGQKLWFDNDDQDGIRPDSITIYLLANGVVVDSMEVTADMNWEWCFTNLPMYMNHGMPIVYTFSEAPVDGYYTLYCFNCVKNFHDPEKTAVNVTKAWEDSGNQDGIRPAYVVVTLYANGVDTGMTLVLNADNNWQGAFDNLDKYAAGVEIEYTVVENEVAGYETVITGSQAEGYVITNSHTPEVIDIAGAKTWLDNDNQDGVRPESITINLLANGEVVDTAVVTAENGWAWSFTNLPKYQAEGMLINYTVVEASVEDYSTEYNGFNVTNTHTPAKTSVTVTKAWEDNNDQDGIRPNDVTVELMANGVPTGMTLVLNEGNNWQGSFTELDKFANGVEIVYTVAEVTVAGYETVITGSQESGYVVTNYHTPEVVEVAGAKTWVDNDDQDGMRPESITISLLANGVVIDTVTVTAEDGWAWSFTNLPKYENHGQLINYSIVEAAVEGYVTTYNNYNAVNTHAPEKTSVTVTKAWDDAGNQDGIRPGYVTVHLYANGADTGMSLMLGEGNNWFGTFTDLDKYAAGIEIEYTVVEDEVEGYTTVIIGNQAEGYVVTNTHAPELIEVAGSKTWVDNNNQDGVRPESITVSLLANGQVVETVTVTAEDGWAWSFTGLPKYEAEGVLINYTVVETAVEDYSTEYDGFNIINTHTPAKTSVTVTKAWEDNNDQDGIRPDSVTVELMANGVPTGMTLVLNEGNNWQGSFTELDKFANGVEIVYTVAEVTVEGYQTVITGSQTEGFVITNSYTPEVIEIAGGKTWDDANNQDGMRPESITIRLYADGELVEVIEVTAEDDWAWSFTNLPKYRDHGVEIVYTITEDAVEGYVTEYDGFNVINRYDPEEISITVTKRWEGDNTKPKNSGHRVPVTIRLYADGEEIDSIVLNEENNWNGVFTDLPKYRPEGELIEYTISEDEVEYYTVIINGNVEEGFVVTNTHIPVTGDERTAPTLWIGLMVASVVAAGGAAAYVTRRKKTAK